MEDDIRKTIACTRCNGTFEIRGNTIPMECELCQQRIMELKCLKCGATWNPYRATLPKVCPKCKSPTWFNMKKRKGGI